MIFNFSTKSRRIQAAQRLVKRGQRTLFGVISEQSDNIVFFGENVIGETAQGAFGTDLNKRAYAVVVERVETLLPTAPARKPVVLQVVFNFGNCLGIHATGDVGHDG